MYEYRQVISQMRLGESDRAIAKAGLVSRTKAKQIRMIASTEEWLDPLLELPADETLSHFFKKRVPCVQSESLSLTYQDEINQWVSQGIQASTIHKTLQRKYSFTGSYDSVQRFVLKIKINNAHKNASTVLDFLPGESAQVDFGMGPMLTDVHTGESFKTWIFVMVLSWSRHQYAEIITNQKVETWLGCHKRAFEFFGGVPKRIIIDNAKCAITRACYYDPNVQRSYAECAQSYGFVISACPPREPKKKGRVESGVKYVKNNFVPLRDFRSISDANAQLLQWVLGTAGNRKHGTTYEKPLTLFNDTEKFLLKSLPENPVELCAYTRVKLHGDCHAQYEKCRYSAPHKFVHQLLWLRASESTVRIYHDYNMIAIHPRQHKPGSRHTIDEHMPPKAQAYKMRDPQWCLTQSKKIGEHCHLVIDQLFNDTVLDQLRAAQGICSLEKKYSKNRLNAACKRAQAFNTVNYRSIKNILEAGVEYDTLASEEAFDLLSDTYTGNGKYSRDTKSIIQ
ncbi:MAG: IS21 family transposase [Gammaproteobacteria bacterium]|nr:IS21 family transposase [Gammaproteobacteria bacterium]